MAATPIFRVVRAEQIGDGVFIEFADGKNALFPEAFFRAHYAWFTLGPVDVDAPLTYDA